CWWRRRSIRTSATRPAVGRRRRSPGATTTAPAASGSSGTGRRDGWRRGSRVATSIPTSPSPQCSPPVCTGSRTASHRRLRSRETPTCPTPSASRIRYAMPSTPSRPERWRALRSATRSSTTTSTTRAPSSRCSTVPSPVTSANGISSAADRRDPRRLRHSGLMSTKPVIGITTYAQNARWGAWALPAALIPHDYVPATERAGGRPVRIPPADDEVDGVLEILDGVVFSGGADIGPGNYGADAHPETDEPQERRDRAEMALLAAALDRDVPTLAICRGFQLLNIVRGGDLVQHLPDTLGDARHREVRGVFSEHPVEVKEGSQLAAVLGARQPAVKSSHHQGVGRVGDGLVETAWAEDGTLEGLEDPSRRFALGVLWH